MADSEDSCSTPWEESFTLPPDVIPSHYDLYMHPDLSTKTFSGSVDIKIYCAESRDHLIVHTKWLNITDTKVHRRDGGIPEEIPILETFEYKPNEFWIIKLLGVDEGYYTITLDFEGSLTNGILGFYYSEYTDEMGINRGLATTKFEPTYARRAFPCFDEPGWRTTYNITVVRPSEGYIALSNMPIEEELVDTPEPGLTEVVFEKAVPMVTYLVCFIVCDFTYKEIIMEDTDIPFRVYAPPGRIDNAKYALDTGVEVLMYYEDIFDSTFPLPKCDMAAIPDYSSGATEHWGIITFRETSIFYNANQSSAVNKQRVTSVIAHELAHQWFGNLVTMKWWDDLWLNEGFASYMEFKGVNSVYPTWQMDSQFPIVNLQSVFIDDSLISSHPIIQPVENNDDINAIFNSIAYDKDAQFQCKSLQRVMVIDGGLCSHPIVQKVGNNDQINAMFDAISYLKGSSVLRMLEDFMGQYFQAGIVAFLKKYEYSNAITQDLWNELTNSWEGHHPVEEKGDVGAIMDTWTRQMGYPVVNVRRTSANSFNLTQTRFLQDPTAEYDPSESDYGYKWDIPVSYLTSAQTEVQRDWLYMHMPSLELKFPSDVLWIKVNMKQKGFYRVNYDASVWRALEGLCIDKVLDVPERSSLLNDAIALADAALLDYNTALNMTRILATERDYIPWDAAFGQLVLLQKRLLGTAASDLFNKYVSYLAEPVYSELGWEDTGEHLQKLLRNDIVTIACASGSTVCLQAAGSQLKSWIIDGKFPLPLGTRREIYRWGTIYEGSQETWDVMWQRALAEQSATETDNLYYGMANVQNTVILARYIELAQDEKNVRSQNFLHILQYISSNPAGSDFVWAWVRSNWEWLVGRYTLNDRYLGQLIPNICKYFTTESKLSEMEAFFAKYPDAGAGELNRQQALETVRFNIRWVKDNAQTILDWLSTQ